MRRGYSRDHRSDCEPMVIAPIVNREGFPFSSASFCRLNSTVQLGRRGHDVGDQSRSQRFGLIGGRRGIWPASNAIIPAGI
ncbi:MAG TPA: hypothetical protein VKV15_19035 [Bryobacteraceae bacterium]|nr:hypothetical protein [Bryobacteraceae bacterium]